MRRGKQKNINHISPRISRDDKLRYIPNADQQNYWLNSLDTASSNQPIRYQHFLTNKGTCIKNFGYHLNLRTKPPSTQSLIYLTVYKKLKICPSFPVVSNHDR